MELLLKSDDPNEISRLKLQLESNGIPVFIGNENTARNFQYLGADAKQTLWVFVKEQYHEALSLLNDSDYEVKHKIDVVDFYRSLDKNNNRMNENFFNRMMLVIVIGAIMAFAYYVYIKINI